MGSLPIDKPRLHMRRQISDTEAGCPGVRASCSHQCLAVLPAQAKVITAAVLAPLDWG